MLDHKGKCSNILASTAKWLALWTAGRKVLGSNPISHVGFFCPGQLLPRAGIDMDPVGRLEPHS